MPDSTRHFTINDDWVTLNHEVTSTEYRVYSIIKGNLVHTYGGIPETGFRATAAWVVEICDGMFSIDTVRKSIRGLVKKGVLRRLNDPQSGEGAELEFVVEPDKSYAGPRSVMARAAELNKVKGRKVAFTAIPLRRKPPRSDREEGGEEFDDLALDEAMLEEIEGGDVFEGVRPDSFEEEPGPAVEPAVEEEPEFDLSGLDDLVAPGRPTPAMVEFAYHLEATASQHSDDRLKLLEGACRRIAVHARPALERGWEPKTLAKRLSAELNPNIHSPEQFLVKKFKDVGNPPVGRRDDGKIRVDGQIVDPGTVDLGFGHDSAPVNGATQTPSGARQRREAPSDRLARLVRGYGR